MRPLLRAFGDPWQAVTEGFTKAAPDQANGCLAGYCSKNYHSNPKGTTRFSLNYDRNNEISQPNHRFSQERENGHNLC
jgi:hypothetical protein